ncbi:trigger factor [Lachnospiraceae bacterium HCP1S3_C3]|nr:trigger factor [Lachnospiraceae bacterium]
MRKNVFMSRVVVAALSISMVMGVAGCGNSDKASNSAKKYVTLGEYKNLDVDLTVSTITDEAVEEEIQSTLEQNAENQEVTDRTTVQEGDIVNINMTAIVDGEDFDDANLEDSDYTLGDNEYGEDFDKAFIGKNKGDTFDLTVTLPSDYSDDTYAGKEAAFNITINKIEKSVVPELNDEFVQSVSDDCKTVDEYRKYVKEDLQKTADDDNESSAKEDLMALAVENATIKGSSDDTYNLYYNQLVNDYTSYAQQWGMTFDNFISQFMGMDEESFKDFVLDQVYDIQVAMAIADKEKLTVSDKEYKTLLKQYAEDYGWDSTDELEKAYSKEYLKNNMTRDKVLDFLFENANVNKVAEEDETTDDTLYDEETDSESETETESETAAE